MLGALIKESDVMVYSIGVFDAQFTTQEERLGPELLARMSELTGASAYSLESPEHLPAVAQHIANEATQSVHPWLQPRSPPSDGKWRKIKVKLPSREDCHGFAHKPEPVITERHSERLPETCQPLPEAGHRVAAPYRSQCSGDVAEQELPIQSLSRVGSCIA